MRPENLKRFVDGLLNVVVETPKGSEIKFDYDPSSRMYCLSKTLPVGMAFPFNFGFVPRTKAEDGDPVDVLLLADQPLFPGCVVPSRILGAIEARQTAKNGRKERNDRVVAVAAASTLYADLGSVKDLNKNMVKEIEQFFKDYNREEGKTFKPLKWVGARAAKVLIERSRI
jgi:inorganic pyrophosphatase